MFDTDAIEEFIVSLASAARELGVDQERERILRLVEDSAAFAEGGPRWKDRLIERIEAGEVKV